MTDSKVYLLDGGTLVIDASDVHWHIDAGTPVRFPVYSVLIEHPDALILYDTGYDLDHVNAVLPFEEPLQTPEQTIPAQLALCGYKPEDVDIVVNSHFHFDHVGGNKYLTNATTLVHKEELRHAKVPEPFERLGYSDVSFDHPAVTYKPISGDYEIVPGVWLFETPGHTIGHYSLLIELEHERNMLFCGDAAYTRTTLEKEWIAGFHLDPTKSVEAIRRLNYLARTRDADIYPSHELASYQGWKLAPDNYGGA
ncbi:N-acyl homoserine lactonase family protein [uncultured Amnibacterium sp.]|uniref:4-pyridoxolactonase n=1 Tax=uncultured Amnibacterium sp. TaxID=1631851 RepID=UPI0035CAB770